MAFDTLDTQPYCVAAGLVLSNGNLTATANNAAFTGANQCLAMPFEGKSTGKWYIEAKANTAGGADAFGVVSNEAIALSGGNAYGFIGVDGGAGSFGQFGIGYKQDGDINYNRLYLIGQHPIVTWGTWTTGAVLGLALDLINGVFWWRVNGGPWLGLTNTGSPTLNTGGIPLSSYSIIGNKLYWPAVSMSNGASYTFNFGATAFVYDAPSGFTAGWTNTNGQPLGSWMSNGVGGAVAPPSLMVSPYVCPYNGTITKLQGGNSNLTTGIGVVYDSDGAGGGPGTLLAYGPVTNSILGCNTYTLNSPLSVSSGHTYYLGVYIIVNGPYSYVNVAGGAADGLWVDTTAVYPTPNPTFTVSSQSALHLPMMAIGSVSPPPPPPPAPIYCAPFVIGATYCSKGQILRPAAPQESQTQSGPSQGKKRRQTDAMPLLYATQGMSMGVDFLKMRPLTFNSAGGTIPLTVQQLYSGVYKGQVDADSNYDNMWCWEVCRPYPCTVVSVECQIQTNENL